MLSAEKYGPWAVVAGASEGVGLAFVKKVARVGINVVMIARNLDKLENAAKEVRAETGMQVRTLAADLGSPDIVERVRTVTDDLDVGLLIFNAALTTLKPFVEKTLEEQLLPVKISVMGQTLLLHHFVKPLVARKRGGIIMVGALSGNAGMANIATYSGSKAYTQYLGEALWAEMRPHNVDVLVMVLGSTDTPSRRRIGSGKVSGVMVLTPEEVTQHALDNIANGPVQVPPPIQKTFDTLSTLPRRQAVESVSTAIPKSAPNQYK